MNWFACSSVKPDAEANVLCGWAEDGDFAAGFFDGEQWRCVNTGIRFEPQPDMWAAVDVPPTVPGVLPGQLELGVAA